MKKNKGITMIVLVITIALLLILAGISIQSGGNIIKRADLENLKTDMLLIKVKGKELLAQAMSHEIDHLNGELFIDKIIPGTLEYIEPEDDSKSRRK